jgi:3-deoxy-D-manno-octulosonic-acid transferase
MFIIYRLLINLVFLLSPFILIFRILKKKEDIHRFKEKFCFFSKTKKPGKLVWFHGASVGELQSIIPLLEKLDKNKKISQILVTSNTLSSSKIISQYKFKKVIHQFFPIDQNFITKKFIRYWQPSIALFIDSEIWPNMLSNLKKNNIPILLLNGRITKKTFKRWQSFKSFSKIMFGKFSLCLSSSKISKNYLIKLGAQNVKFIGNLKFSQSENEKVGISKDLKRFFLTKKNWCASSTHSSEEKFCGLVHKKLKKKYKNLVTIIIPRHVNRIENIKNELEQMNLNIHLHEPKKKINNNTDIYLVNSYGITKSFYSICKNVFLGGSLINHGGQNPLEAVRFGCRVFHGSNVENFSEIYDFLRKNKISNKITSHNKLIFNLEKFLSKKRGSKKEQSKIKLIGKKILDSTHKEVIFTLKNEI